MNKICLRYVAPGAFDLPKRSIYTGDPKAVRDVLPCDRLARAASEIKHRCSCG